MLYPQKGLIAIGSSLRRPTAPSAAAVVSTFIIAPTSTPCSQLNASQTSGTSSDLLPPKRMADTGTPRGSSHLGESIGYWPMGKVNLEFGWAAGAPPGFQGLPCQSNTEAAGGCPSHQGVRSAVMPTFVNTVSFRIDSMRFGLVFS